MFDAIAPRYDLLNTVLSGGLDRYWRRRAIGRLDSPATKRCSTCAPVQAMWRLRLRVRGRGATRPWSGLRGRDADASHREGSREAGSSAESTSCAGMR